MISGSSPVLITLSCISSERDQEHTNGECVSIVKIMHTFGDLNIH